MSLVFNMVGAGGGGSAELPAIYVTYPEGSICTCSKGSETYTAKDTSGYWLFAGLEVGTWTVTISDPTGTHTDKSTTATITDAGEVVDVTLIYGLWLYKDGDQFVENTGGWSTPTGWSVADAYDISQSLTYGETMYGTAGVSKAIGGITGLIDLTNYNALKFTLVDRNSVAATKMYASILSSTHNTFGTDDIANLDFMTAEIGSELSLDISDITGEYYVGFATIYERYFSVNNIRLE